MDYAMTTKLLVLLCGALWFYFQAVRADQGKPTDRLRELIMMEARNATEIEQLEARLTALNPNWRQDQLAASYARFDQLKAEGRLYERA